MEQEKASKFAVNRVRTGTGDERRKTKKSDGIYQQCDIKSDNDIPRIEQQCLSVSQIIIFPVLRRRKLLGLFNFDCYQPS